MKKNTWSDCSDCNEKAVKSAAGNISNARRVASHEHDEIGAMSSKFLSNTQDRKNGQAKL